jgi:hypothetical protein
MGIKDLAFYQELLIMFAIVHFERKDLQTKGSTIHPLSLSYKVHCSKSKIYNGTFSF